MLIGQYLFSAERGERDNSAARERTPIWFLRERGVSALKAENSMMTMTTMADGLEAQDSSKSAFMEFGQQSHSQQSSPSMAGGHYPLHCLHSGSHAHHQHDGSPYAGTNTYNRSLPYPYVSHPHHSPYLPAYHNSAGGQTRLDGTGKPSLSGETKETQRVASRRRPSVRPQLFHWVWPNAGTEPRSRPVLAVTPESPRGHAG